MRDDSALEDLSPRAPLGINVGGKSAYDSDMPPSLHFHVDVVDGFNT
jgi:hypothetical protein